MATIAEILQHIWPGTEWTVDDDDYATLNWAAGNGVTKPTEEEIRSHDAEVDAVISDEGRLNRQQRAMPDAPDYLLKTVETLIDGLIEIRRVVNDLRTTIVSQAHTGSFTSWDNDVVTKIANLKQRIADLRNIT